MPVPARVWLKAYDTAWLRADVMAGVTLAAYLLPSAIGDASLAGLPPQAGLYACLFGRPRLLDVLQLASHGDLRHLGDLAPDWRDARRDRRKRSGALCGACSVHRADRRRAGLHRVRVPCGRHRELLLRNGARRIQVRRGAVSGQHAAPEAVWLQRRSWRRLLGSHGALSRRPGPDQFHVARRSDWRRSPCCCG